MSGNGKAAERRGRFGRGLTTALLLGLSAAGVVGAQQYEEPQDRRAAEVLPPE